MTELRDAETIEDETAGAAETVARYTEDIVRRGRVPMAPFDYHPDWRDQPRRHKVYRGTPRFALPEGTTDLPRSLWEVLGRPAGDQAGDALQVDGDRPFSLDLLAGMLRYSYGLLERRLCVTCNFDVDGRTRSRHTSWGRGTASGGGLYPCEIYWVTGAGGTATPGVYHYSTPHHAMQRLLDGDVTDRIRAAAPGNIDVQASDQFLLVTVRFWKNAFKYNSFCYHVVTMDTGCLLATWQLWARAAGAGLEPAFWFDERELDDLLGLDVEDESVLAVVPLRGVDGPDAGAGDASFGRPVVDRPAEERSVRVERFERISEVHLATLVDGQDRPPPETLAAAAPSLPPAEAAVVALPDPAVSRPDRDLPGTLARRRSSFGLFSAARSLGAGELGAVLAAAGHGRHLGTDLRGRSDAPLTRLAVFVSHVDGVPDGAYDYDPGAHTLRLIPGGPVNPFLQHTYFLNNYNVEQAAAVVVAIGRPRAIAEHVAPRALRVLNAEVGAVAETVYLAAAGLGVSCGAALGFDNVSYQERLGLADGDEWPLLMFMLGHERQPQADLVHRLV